MNKKLAIIAVACTVLIILGGINTSVLYGTEYMSSKTGYLYSITAVAEWWNCNWSYCKKITIDHTKVQANQDNFPVLIYTGSDSDLASHAQSDGDDIAFVDQYNLTQYKHEIEYYDSSTGNLSAWVKIPSLSSSSDTILYMYYGNPSCSSQENITATWNSNYKMVQHLNESGATLFDSTSNDNDGSKSGDPTANSSSKIDGGYDFDGDDYINCENDSSLNISSQITLEGWVKDPPLLGIEQQSNNDVTIVDKRDEQLPFIPGEQFIVERTVSSDGDADVVFVALFSSGVILKDMNLDGESVFAGVYTAGRPGSKEELEIEEIRKKLPDKLKELGIIAYSKSFKLQDKATMQMQFETEKWYNLFPDERISYLVISSDGEYDFEGTTYLSGSFCLIDWFNPFSIFEAIVDFLTGGGDDDKPSDDVSDMGYTSITALEAKEMIDSEQDVIVLDVRTTDEYDYGHIEGALSVPLDNLSDESYINEVLGKCKWKNLLLYSSSGFQSEQACKILSKKGFTSLKNLDEGLYEWEQKGYPVINISFPIVDVKPYVFVPRGFSDGNRSDDAYKVINESFYRNWLNDIIKWTLFKSSDKVNWVDCSNLLVVDKVWNPYNYSEKHTLSWVADTEDYYELRLQTKHAKGVKSYTDLSKNKDKVKDRVNLGFGITDTDDYEIFFDWSDYKNSPEFSKTSMSKELTNVSNKKNFSWSVCTNQKLTIGEKFVVDPTFGRTTTSPTALYVHNNQFVGGKAALGETGTIESITAYCQCYGSIKNWKAYIYDSVDTQELLGTSDQISFREDAADWYTFTFTTKPTLSAGTYWLMVHSDAASGYANVKYYSVTGPGIGIDSGLYSSGPPDPATISIVDSSAECSIYATYSTNTAPTMDSFNIDADDGMNAGWDGDNDDAQMDWETSDADTDPVTVYITFNKGSTARLPTTGDYDYHVQDDDAIDKDCDWTGGTWSDYDGAIHVRIRAHDGTVYSSTQINDTLANGIDGTNPTGTIDGYGTENPSSIEGDSSDATSGVASNDITIEDTTDNDWWTGSEWGSETWLDCTGTTTWSYDSSGVSWDSGHEITVTLRIYDSAGNVDSSADTELFTTSYRPDISFDEPPTPANNTETSDTYANVSVNVSDNDNENISSFIDWNHSLVGYWNMDYINSTGVFDNSTYDNFANYTGGIGEDDNTTGKYGKALTFNGTSDYLEVPDHSSLDITDEITIEAYVDDPTRYYTQTFYAALDGYIINEDADWSACRSAASGDTAYDSNESYTGYLVGGNAPYIITRLFYSFDTSSIPDDATIVNATYYCGQSVNEIVTQGTQGDSLTVEDFDAFTGGEYCTLVSQGKNQYEIGYFNSTGLSGISKTDKTYLSQRHPWDVNDVNPGTLNAIGTVYFSENSTMPPKLNITYTDSSKTIVSKTQDAYELSIRDDNQLYGFINNVSVNYTIDETWRHVALTYDGSTIKLYKDGALVDSTAYSGTITTNAENLLIGEDFSGEIDEVRLWNRALTNEEINASYNSSATYYHNFTGLSVDTYQYYAYAIDEMGSENTTETRNFTVTTANNAPTQSGEVPANQSTGIALNPRLVINASDTEGDWMNVTFRTNATGSWGDIGTNTTHGSHWVNQTNSSFDAYSTKYWWSVNLTDGMDWCNETYHFTTTQATPNITSESPNNESIDQSLNPTLSVQANHSNGYKMNITWYWGTTASCPNYIGTNNTVSNGTYSQPDDDSNFSSNDQKYYWKVIVNDGHGGWTNETYWFTTIGANKEIISKGRSAYSLEINPNGDTLYGYIDTTTIVSTSIDTNWHYVALTFSGSTLTLYKDGASVDTDSGSMNTNANNLTLGNYLTGTLDEIRVSNTARGAAWINTTYQNTNSPTTFATFGSQIGILSTWSYRKKITINASLVNATLTNFPVLIYNSSDSNLASNALSTGNDILFTNSSVDWITGNCTDRLAHEIELFNGTSGELVVWVKIPTLSSGTNTEIYMYYGNSLCTSNRQNPTGVWDSNYIGVWHHNQTSGTVDDSTSNNLDLTNDGATSQSSGKIDGCFDFEYDNDNELMKSTENVLNITGNISLEAWVRPEGAQAQYSYITHKSKETYTLFLAGASNDSALFLLVEDPTEHRVWSNAELNTQNWYYVAGTYDGTDLKMYINGSEEQSNTAGSLTIDTNAKNFEIGGANDSANKGFDGYIDEVRLSNIARNSSWINTTYNNINDTANFTTFGSQEIQNVAPTQSSPSPSDGAAGQSLNPTLSIQVNDTNIDAMNVTFRTNATGSWGDIGTNTSVYNGTYSQTNSSMDSYNATYWWSVNVTDGATWTNATYSFNTSLFYSVTISSPFQDGYVQLIDGTPDHYNKITTGDDINIEDPDLRPASDNYRGYVEWDISGIPDTATILDVDFIYHGHTHNSDCKVYDVDNQPSATAAQTLWSDLADGSEFANINGFPVAGANQEIDLNASAESDFQGRLSDDWWAIGIIAENLTIEATTTIYSENYSSVNPAPSIRVNYTVSSSPYLYAYRDNRYRYISDFIPDATTASKEYIHILDITSKTDVINGKVRLKITEELDETTYLDQIYLRVDGSRIIELDSITIATKDSSAGSTPDLKTAREQLFSSQINKQLLRQSDDHYLLLNEGDEYYIEFSLPSDVEDYDNLEFVTEGYYIKHDKTSGGRVCR